MPSISTSIASVHQPDPAQRPPENPVESIRSHVQSLATTVEAFQGYAHYLALRDMFEPFKDNLAREGTWDGVQHLFNPSANKDEMLDALANCHIDSFELGGQYLHWKIGSEPIDSSVRCVLGQLTSEARDSMLKDLPVLTLGPKPADNDNLRIRGFPRVALTLSETGLRLAVDARHTGNDSGNGGLSMHEAEQLLARIQKEEARQTEEAPDGARTQPAPKGPATNTDQWLAERLRKFQPSFSVRRDPTLSLNGVVAVNHNVISCGHIARLWEEDFMRTAGKPTYQSLNSPTALARAAAPISRYDSSYPGGAIGERVDGAHYWMSNDWGQVLTQNFDAMSRQAPKDGAVCRTLYLLTPNHAMALGLKIKDGADARRYVVQFYDPNKTVAHQRSAITATLDQLGVPAEIRTFRPTDFLPANLQKNYRLIDVENRSVPAIFVGEKAEPEVPRLAGNLPDLDEQVMHAVLAFNLPEQLHDYAEQLKQMDDVTRLKILTSENHVGCAGLFVALERGHAEVIEALADILKACQPPISPSQLMLLLSAKNPFGLPGLYSALRNGNTETVKAFGELLKTCEPPLSSEQLMFLFSAEDRYGNTGLKVALQRGHDATVQAFGELLKACQPTLSTGQIFELLSAKKSDDDASALLAAFRHASSDTIAAFGKMLTTFQPALSSEQLMDLVLAKDGNGTTGLSVALESGDAAKVRAFGELLKPCQPSLSDAQLKELFFANSDGKLRLPNMRWRANADFIESYGALLGRFQPSLPSQPLIELLSARSAYSNAGLHLALKDGNTDEVKTFGNLLKTCEPFLSSEDLMVLLSARDRSGDSGLHHALQNGHDETVEAFAEILKSVASRLMPEQLQNLLEINLMEDFTALHSALLKGDTKWIESYGKLLETMAASLSTEQLAEIFDTEGELGSATLQGARRNGHVEALAAFETLKAKFAPHP